MRYYRELGPARIASWIWFPIVLAAYLVRRGSPLWVAGMVVATGTLLCLPSHLLRYWEILPDRVVERRFFRRLAIPFPEIDYCGPVTGGTADHSFARKWVEVRGTSGDRMIVQAADPQGFLRELRRRSLSRPNAGHTGEMP